MQMVNAAVLEGWSVLPDQVVVEPILDGHVGLFEVLMRRVVAAVLARLG